MSPEPSPLAFPLSTSASTSSMTTQPGGRESGQSSTEKLTVPHGDDVKGVIIKGVVCTPKLKNKSKSNSVASLNPFEKRLAPKPPSSLEAVPKTKPNKRGFQKLDNISY